MTCGDATAEGNRARTFSVSLGAWSYECPHGSKNELRDLTSAASHQFDAILASGIDNQRETRQQFSGIDGAKGRLNNPPSFAVAAVHAKSRAFRVFSWIDQPVFLDRRNLQIQFDVANQ